MATTRLADEGTQLRPDLGASVYDALKGITISATSTFGKEDKIGRIKKGKVANFTLLQQDPMKIDPLAIKDIVVDGVIYKSIYHSSKK